MSRKGRIIVQFLISLWATFLIGLGSWLIFLGLSMPQLEETKAESLTEVEYINYPVSDVKITTNAYRQLAADQLQNFTSSTTNLKLQVTSEIDQLSFSQDEFEKLNLSIQAKIEETRPDLLRNTQDQFLKIEITGQDSVALSTDEQNIFWDSNLKGGFRLIKRDSQVIENEVTLATADLISNWDEMISFSRDNEQVEMGTGREMLHLLLVHELIHFHTNLDLCTREEAEELAHDWDAVLVNEIKPHVFVLN